MPLYRVVLLAEDGSARVNKEIDCDDDDEAIERAGELDHPFEINVWDGERLVARFPPRSELEFDKG